MNFFLLCQSACVVAVNDQIFAESLPRMAVPLVGPQFASFGARLSFKPIRTLWTSTKDADEQVFTTFCLLLVYVYDVSARGWISMD
jgi:hypothetical protein